MGERAVKYGGPKTTVSPLVVEWKGRALNFD